MMKNESLTISNQQICEEDSVSIKMVENLIPNLLDLLLKGKLSRSSARELAYLTIEQEWVYRYYTNHKVLPSMKSAKKLRECNERHKLTLAELNRIMKNQVLSKPKKIVFERKELEPYFEADMTDEEIKQAVSKVVHFWKNRKKNTMINHKTVKQNQ